MSDMRMRRVTKGCGAEGSPHSPRSSLPRGLHCTHMADIQFETEQDYTPTTVSTESRGLAALVMRLGLAKDEKTARYVLLGIAVAAVVLAFVVPALIGGGTKPPLPWKPPAANDIPPGFTPYNKSS